MTESEAIRDIKDNVKPSIGGISLDMAIQALEEIQQYRAIGTVEEFKELKEKAEPKKPKMVIRFGCTTNECTVCGNLLHDNQYFCQDCGTEIDWT